MNNPASVTEVEASPTTAPTSSPAGFRVLASSVLAQTTGLVAVFSAFLWYAGFTFLNQLYSAFGLQFGSVSPSFPEVIGQGYVVILFALFTWLKSMMGFWFASVILVALMLIAASMIIKVSSWGKAALDKLSSNYDTIERTQTHILLAISITLLLIAAAPAGSLGATVEIKNYRAKIDRGDCFSYSDGQKKVIGVILASNTDHVFIIGKGGLDILKTDGLTVRAVEPAQISQSTVTSPSGKIHPK